MTQLNLKRSNKAPLWSWKASLNRATAARAAFRNFLERELGRIYRHQLASGVSMHLVNLDSGEPATKVIIRDPLCQMTDSYEVNRYGGTMPVKGNVRLVFDGVDVKSYPAIKDPVTGGYAVVEILMVNYDVRRVYDALGVQANATVGGKEVDRAAKGEPTSAEPASTVFNRASALYETDVNCAADNRWAFLHETRSNSNYFKGQVSFPTCLDRLFGVQYVKNRFGIDPRLADVLRDRCQADHLRHSVQPLEPIHHASVRALMLQ